MRVKFYVDRKDAPVSALMVDIAFNGKRSRYSSGISIEPRHWNHSAQEVRSGCPGHVALNKQIAAITTEVRSAFHGINFGAGGKIITSAEYKRFNDRIKRFLSGESTGGRVSFAVAFQKFIADYRVGYGNGQITNKRPSEPTLQRYRLVSSSIEEFAKKQRIKLEFENIDEHFYRQFVAWLSGEKNIIDASVGNYIKVLKTFMKWTRDRGWHDNSMYERFHKPDSVADTIALSARELRLIRDVDLSDSPKLARVRDHFLIQSYTGLRYGDLQRLGPSHFDDNGGFIIISTMKTDSVPVIPIIPPLVDVLSRYPSRVFEFNSAVKANLYLKEVGKRAGLTSPVIQRVQRNGIMVTENVPKYTQLTTHVARRSFVTIGLEFGLSEVIIRQVTGHKANDVMSKHYAKPEPVVVHDLVCKAWTRL